MIALFDQCTRARPLNQVFGVSAFGMTEEAYIQRIRELWTESDADLTVALSIAKRGVVAYPLSARLLSMLGDLIQLAGSESDALEDALACYRRATVADPTSSEAYTSIGYYHDVHTQDLDAAEHAFRQSLACGVTEDAVVGLARVMAQRGYPRDKIRAVLDTAADQTSARVRQMRMEVDSGHWEP